LYYVRKEDEVLIMGSESVRSTKMCVNLYKNAQIHIWKDYIITAEMT
jgi:hypothetical protein